MSDSDQQKLKGSVKLGPSKLTRSEMIRQNYTITPEPGVTLEHLLEPTYWANHCNGGRALRVGDHIEVVMSDNSAWILLRVIRVEPTFAKVVVLNAVRFDEGDMSVPENAGEEDPFEIRHTPGNLKWWILRKADKKRIMQGYATKEDAAKALVDYKAALRR